jgi:V8-like Glu-specific endopeptidase
LVAVFILAMTPSSLVTARGADRSAVERARVLDHWTEARMRAAVPRDLVVLGSPAPRTVGGPLAEIELASSPWGGGAIAARSGKVFLTLAGVDYVCSGSVIDDGADAAYSLVLTAAHCAYDEAADVFASEWIYVPDFDAAPTYDCTTVAYDCWAARALAVHTGWTSEESLTVAALRHDYAVAVVGPGLLEGEQVDALGAYPVRIGPVPAGDTADIFGYPAAPPFQGDELTHCSGAVTVADDVGGWRMTCDMTGGASGGPWLHGAADPADGSGAVGSVSSYRIKGDAGLYGPRLDSATRAVIDAAKAATPDATGIDGLIVSGSTPGPGDGPPQTTIVDGPEMATSSATAIFNFAADEPATFGCALDAAPFTACTSPTTYAGITEGAHTFRVRATDVDAEVDPSPASWAWTVDTTVPVAAAPVSRLVRGTRLGASTAPVKLTWSATDGLTGISAYGLWQRTDGAGPWLSVPLPTALTTTISRSLTPGHAYEFRVRATDGAGNVVDATAAAFDLRLAQQGAGSRLGRWRKVTTTSASGGSYVYATATGASFSYQFSGRGFAWIGAMTPQSGKAKVYIDGVLVARVGLYAATKRTRVLLFTTGWAAIGTHSIKVTVVGTAGHPRVNLDAFVRLD